MLINKKQILWVIIVFLMLLFNSDKLYAADISQDIEMEKVMKWGFFPHENERGLTSYFPEVTFKLKNAGNQPIIIKKVVITYMYNLSRKIIYIHRIPLSKKIKSGENIIIKSVSKYGFSKKELFVMLSDQYDPIAIGGDTGDVGESIIALIQVDEMEGAGWPISFRNKWLREGYSVKNTNKGGE